MRLELELSKVKVQVDFSVIIMIRDTSIFFV
jgi:hypothetical protein